MTHILSSALRLLEQGWSVIPIQPAGKRPLLPWVPFQQRRPQLAEVEAWWKRWPEANVGVVTGALSGIVVLDVDGKEGDKSLGARKVVLPPTTLALTGNGLHYYFRRKR